MRRLFSVERISMESCIDFRASLRRLRLPASQPAAAVIIGTRHSVMMVAICVSMVVVVLRVIQLDFFLAAVDQSGQHCVACIYPAAEFGCYLLVIRIALDELTQGADSEGLQAYIEDEADKGIKLALSEVLLDAVDFRFGFLNILLEECIGCFLSD